MTVVTITLLKAILPMVQVPLTRKVAAHYDRVATKAIEERDALHGRLRDLAARLSRLANTAQDDGKDQQNRVWY